MLGEGSNLPENVDKSVCNSVWNLKKGIPQQDTLVLCWTEVRRCSYPSNPIPPKPPAPGDTSQETSSTGQHLTRWTQRSNDR